eukprot:1233159-Pyramimonas_sp.AAC.1
MAAGSITAGTNIGLAPPFHKVLMRWMNFKFPCRDPETGDRHVLEEQENLMKFGATGTQWVTQPKCSSKS